MHQPPLPAWARRPESDPPYPPEDRLAGPLPSRLAGVREAWIAGMPTDPAPPRPEAPFRPDAGSPEHPADRPGEQPGHHDDRPTGRATVAAPAAWRETAPPASPTQDTSGHHAEGSATPLPGRAGTGVAARLAAGAAARFAEGAARLGAANGSPGATVPPAAGYSDGSGGGAVPPHAAGGSVGGAVPQAASRSVRGAVPQAAGGSGGGAVPPAAGFSEGLASGASLRAARRLRDSGGFAAATPGGWSDGVGASRVAERPVGPAAQGVAQPVEWTIARHRSGEWPTVRGKTGRLDKSRWHWLLLVPIVLPLMPVIYNRMDPALFGMPFFYWSQLGFAFLASGVIAFVHMKVR